jgi:hypothetical protein
MKLFGESNVGIRKEEGRGGLRRVVSGGKQMPKNEKI